MKFPTRHFHVSIYIEIFERPIRIPPFLCCGCHLLISSLVGFFLAHVMLSFLRVKFNVERLLAFLIYSFHNMKLQLSLDMVENSSKVLHHHSRLFHRGTQLDGLPPELRSVFFHSFYFFLSMILPLHELILLITHGIEFFLQQCLEVLPFHYHGIFYHWKMAHHKCRKWIKK